MKVEKNINGGGFFDWFTRKKTEIERVWDNHIEKREVFINELSLIIKARNATCKDREANATRKALSQLKKSAKSKSTTQFPKDLDTLKHIVEKWDDRVISYAKELGETCGSFRIVQRKSHLLLKIEERLDIEKRIEDGIKTLSNADASQDLKAHVTSVTTLINTPSTSVSTSTTVSNGNPVYNSTYLMKPSTTPQIELLKERLRSNRHLSVTASVPSASLYTNVLPVKSAVVYSKPPTLFASPSIIGVSSPSIISMQPSDLRYEMERLSAQSKIAKIASANSDSENAKIMRDYSKLNDNLRNEISDMIKTADTKDELMRKRQKAINDKNVELQKELDDKIKLAAEFQEKKQKEIQKLEDEKNKIKKDAEKEIKKVKESEGEAKKNVVEVEKYYEEKAENLKRQIQEKAAAERAALDENEKLKEQHQKEVDEFNKKREALEAAIKEAEEKIKKADLAAEEAKKAKTEEEKLAAQKKADEEKAAAAEKVADVKQQTEEVNELNKDLREKQESEISSQQEKTEKSLAEELAGLMSDNQLREGDNIKPSELGLKSSSDDDDDEETSSDDAQYAQSVQSISGEEFKKALKELSDEVEDFDNNSRNFSNMLKEAAESRIREYDAKHSRVMSISSSNSEDKKGWIGQRQKLVSALTKYQSLTSGDDLDKEINELNEAIKRRELLKSQGDVTRQSQRVKEQDVLKLAVLKEMKKHIQNKEEAANKLARAVYSKTVSDDSSIDEVMKANENTTRQVLGIRSGNVFTFQQLASSAKAKKEEEKKEELSTFPGQGRKLDEDAAANILLNMKKNNEDDKDSDEEYHDARSESSELEAEEEQRKIDEAESEKIAKKAAEEEAKKAAEEEAKKAAEEEAKKAAEEEAKKAAEEEAKKAAEEEAKKEAEEAKKAAEEEAKKAAEEEAKKAAEEEAKKEAEEEAKKAAQEEAKKAKIEKAKEDERKKMEIRANELASRSPKLSLREQLLGEIQNFKTKEDSEGTEIDRESTNLDDPEPSSESDAVAAARLRAKEYRDREFGKPKGGKSGKSRKRLLIKKRLTKRKKNLN